jgi:KUP system potassium uptake protein
MKKKIFAIVFTVVFLAIQVLFLLASLTKFFHGGWFTMALTLAILAIMYAWAVGTKVERSQRRHMSPEEFLPALDMLHRDESIDYRSDNVVYLTPDPELRRLDTDIFYSIFADHPKRARAWWAVSVQVTDDPYTREYSVENFGTDFLFRVRLRIGFKINQNIATYLHQIMHDLINTGELPAQATIYPKLDEDQQIGTIKYVLIHKDLIPESKIDSRGALALRVKYAIRHIAGSPVKWFGLSAYNPLVEVLPLFVSTVSVAPLKRTALRKVKKPITLQAVLAEAAEKQAEEEKKAAEKEAAKAEKAAAKSAAKTSKSHSTGKAGTSGKADKVETDRKTSSAASGKPATAVAVKRVRRRASSSAAKSVASKASAAKTTATKKTAKPPVSKPASKVTPKVANTARPSAKSSSAAKKSTAKRPSAAKSGASKPASRC